MDIGYLVYPSNFAISRFFRLERTPRENDTIST